MPLLDSFLLAIGLSLDSFAASAHCGSACRERGLPAALRAALPVSFSFGLFQSAMPVLGWAAGAAARGAVAGVDHWVAFFLLAAVGVKAIASAGSEKTMSAPALSTREIIALSLATSVDAFAVGISLAFTGIPPALTIALIGLTTFALSLAGFLFGKRLRGALGNGVAVFGGILLIGIGLKILLEHLAAA
jgi:putative Mn2+ efflux pump MntP